MVTTEMTNAIPGNNGIVCIDPSWHTDDFVEMAPRAASEAPEKKIQAVEQYVQIWGDCEDA